ncbi:hypothetical protein BDR06DRAFT_1002362 [Suillus hirtellus]|nr:hypothetical protein BDR06DRAFT_1002362 [Suillus hirtellus]
MSMEVEILDVEEGCQLTNGIIEDEDDEEDGHSRVNGESLRGETSKRWNHLVCCVVSLSTVVDRFAWVEGTRQRAPAHVPKQWSHPARSQKTVASIIESLQWTVVLIPVLVIMELDGLSSNPSKLGKAAQEAIAYITSLIHSHLPSLKVQATT